jgi:pilus assembly protein Flp/PilA
VIPIIEAGFYDAHVAGNRRREGMGQPAPNRKPNDTERFALFSRKDMSKMVEYVRALLTVDEETEGQGLVEYALIIVLVSIAVIGTLTVLGGKINDVFTTITGAL